MLTGKYKPGEEAPDGTRAADSDTDSVYQTSLLNDENKKKAQEFVKIAGDMGVTAAQLAIAGASEIPR